MLLKYFIFTVVIAGFSYLCINYYEFDSFFNFDILSTTITPTIYTLLASIEKVLVGEEPELGSRSFYSSELKNFDGQDGKEIFVSILGNVFDVSKGRVYYAPGGDYHGFAGRDATRAFVTGDFTEKGLTDDISDFDGEQLLVIKNYMELFQSKYELKGKLVGKYFDKDGNPTLLLNSINQNILYAEEKIVEEKMEKKKYPPCNVEWTQTSGTNVWCTNKSGGIQRDWVGVPRKYHPPGAKSERCACIEEVKLGKFSEGVIEEYKDCNPKSVRCSVPDA